MTSQTSMLHVRIDDDTKLQAQQALKSMVSSSNFTLYDNIGDYKKLGYVPFDKNKKKIGLREMADKLNISPAYLSNLESGKHNMINPLLLKKISKTLEVDHLKLFKIIGYTDKDMEELKKEIMSEILDELEDIDIGELIKELLEMDFEKIELVKQYVSLLKKSN